MSKQIILVFRLVITTLLFIAVSVAISFIAAIPLFFDLEKQGFLWSNSLAFMFSNLLMLALTVIFIKKTNKDHFIQPKSINKRKVYIVLSILFGVIFVLALPVLLSFLYLFIENDNPSNQHIDLVFYFWRLPFLLTAVIIAPIYEELFFRKYILTQMLINYNPLVSILFSSVLFSSAHLMNSINNCFISFFGGLIAGTLFYKTNNIVYSILFHITWNFTIHMSKYYTIPYF